MVRKPIINIISQYATGKDNQSHFSQLVSRYCPCGSVFLPCVCALLGYL